MIGMGKTLYRHLKIMPGEARDDLTVIWHVWARRACIKGVFRGVGMKEVVGFLSLEPVDISASGEAFLALKFPPQIPESRGYSCCWAGLKKLKGVIFGGDHLQSSKLGTTLPSEVLESLIRYLRSRRFHSSQK